MEQRNINGKYIISTHTPHTRCDKEKNKFNSLYGIFLLTHLIRGATFPVILPFVTAEISTHTPHTRCDWIFLNHFQINFISTHTPHTRCDENQEHLYIL